MTEEQEKAIERLNRFKTIEEVLYGGTFAMTLIQLERLQDAIEIVLNMLKEKDKEIRNLKDEINEAWGEWNDLEQTAYEEETRLKTELEKKDKIINLMAEAFKQDDVRTVEEIIEYFKNLAKENNNEI